MKSDSEIALSQPEIAMRWAQTIGDPQQKEEWITKVRRIQEHPPQKPRR